MFEFFFYLLRNGDPVYQLNFDHWPTPEEVATKLRSEQQNTVNAWHPILETWAQCVMENGLPKQPAVGGRNEGKWGATSISVGRKD